MSDLLINATDVANANQGAVSDLDSDSGFRAACVEAAQSVLEQFIGWPPVANVTTQDAEIGASVTAGLRLLSVGVPTLAITTGLSIDHNTRLIISAIPEARTVRFVRGWRPADLSDADLLTLLGTPNDGAGDPMEAADVTAVPEAPVPIRSAIAEAAVAIAGRMRAGLVGMAETTVDIGTNATTVASAYSHAQNDEVTAIIASRCSQYRQLYVA